MAVGQQVRRALAVAEGAEAAGEGATMEEEEDLEIEAEAGLH